MTERLIKFAYFLSIAIFLWSAFLEGWRSQTTDFPNYYTAARLVRLGTPLHLDYDWPWFQRQMERAGVEGQLGGYIPQTPLAMFPVIPLSWLGPQAAKRCWLLLNLLFLAATIHLLSSITGFRRVWLWMLIVGCWNPLSTNFLLGQYYVLILLLFTIAAYALTRNRDASCGVAAGITFGLKLYGAPLALWFAVRRRWGAVAGMAASSAACAALAVAVFGWQEVAYFATRILPRALTGETLNPFHPGNATLTTLLRVTLMAEPELNPHPLVHSPLAFFVLQPLVTLGVLAIPLLSAASFAWFLIAILLASPNTASYTFILLALPVALLLRSLPRRRWARVLFPYIAIGAPIPASWIWMFPRLWLVLALYFEAGRGNWKTIRAGNAVKAAIAILVIAVAGATLRMRDNRAQPDRTFAGAGRVPASIYSSFPAVTPSGIFYQSIAQERYLLRRYRDGKTETFAFAGQALTPSAVASGASVYFELATGAVSRIASLRPDSGSLEVVSVLAVNPREPAISHDGKRLAVVSGDSLFLFDGATTRKLPTPLPVADPSFLPDDSGILFSVRTPRGSVVYVFDPATGINRPILFRESNVHRPALSPDKSRLLFSSSETSSWAAGKWGGRSEQIWLTDLTTGRSRRLTGGDCNNSLPAWGPGPDEIIFASDCGRGLGLPALYRADHILETAEEGGRN